MGSAALGSIAFFGVWWTISLSAATLQSIRPGIYLSEQVRSWDRVIHLRVVEDMKDGKPDPSHLPPTKTKDKRPQYPRAAHRSKLPGAATILARIGVDGKVLEFVKAEGEPQFVDALKEAVAQWRFTPVKFDGTPHELMLCVEGRFVPPGFSSQGDWPAVPTLTCRVAMNAITDSQRQR